MAISQVIDTPPTAPNRATMDDATYSAAADAMMAYLKTLVSEQNLWATQANALAAAMNAVAAGAAYSIAYTFDTTTTDSDPGNGKLRLDNATQGSATTVRMDLLDQAGSDWTAAIDQFDGSTSTVKGYLTLRKLSDGTKWILFSVSARAAPSGYRNISVAVVALSGANPFANGDTIVAEFSRTGDKGNTGATPWTAPAAWTTTTAYTAGPPASVVTFSGETYACLISHTAGVFATDLANGDWIKLVAKGADGAAPSSLYTYGDKSDGNVTVNGAVTLSRDMYYNTLTITAGAALNTNGWRIFADTIDISAAPAGSIFNNGGNGGTGLNGGGGAGTGGAAGAAAPGNTVGASAAGVAGTTGGTGGATVGSAGSAGGNGGAGGAGGAGGQKALAPAAGGGASTASASVLHRATPILTTTDISNTYTKGGASGGSGAAGSGDAGSNVGAGGGGSGAGGGVVAIFARIVIRGASTAASAIQAKGGNGGGGGTQALSSGGGGGAGGGGGWVIIICDSLSGTTATNAVDVTGGGGGAAGSGGTPAAADGGGTGAGGRFTLGVLGSNSWTDTLSGNAALAGNAHSGTTQGAARSATVTQFSL